MKMTVSDISYKLIEIIGEFAPTDDFLKIVRRYAVDMLDELRFRECKTIVKDGYHLEELLTHGCEDWEEYVEKGYDYDETELRDVIFTHSDASPEELRKVQLKALLHASTWIYKLYNVITGVEVVL